MSRNEPVDARIRLAISLWPADAPRGAVTSFCAEHEISRKTFYAILARAKAEGQAAALEPRSRRPLTSPTQIPEELQTQALGVRAALESSGLDYGPISVHDKMIALGMTPVPSVASLARIFRAKGVARAEPKKKPRSAWRRFVYPAPNACWQLDATEYVLAGGRKCVIFQLIDDHSRLAVASHVAHGETSAAAIEVVNKAVAIYGVPQRLLSDNGYALNPSRRGVLGRLVIHLRALGVEPITGKPYKPTTQGKNERFHQTLFRWLDKQPLATTLTQLQAQVDQFDYVYNTQRPHQGLPGRITPQEAWDATPVAEPPVSNPGALRTISATRPKPTAPPSPAPGRRKPHRPATASDAPRSTTVRRNGTIRARKIEFFIGRQYAGQTAYVLYHSETLEFFDHEGTYIAEADWPAPGINYVRSDQLRTIPLITKVAEQSEATGTSRADETVTDLLRHPPAVTDVSTHRPSPES